MNRKLQLVKLILLEGQALKEADTTQGVVQLVQELTKDAVELAKLIEQEEAA